MRFYLNAFPFGARRVDYEAGATMTGADPERFQGVLQEVFEFAQIADQGGMEGICFSEQHSNIEGLPEVTTNPLLYDAAIAGRTKRLKVGQLGMTLSANHPVRLAEDIAMIDQISGGRAFCGFTRGNATRWVETFSQHYGVGIATSDKSEADELNLRAIKEAWAIIKAAWTNDVFSYEGEFWTVPAKNVKWNYPPTATYGKGMADDGTIEQIGIVPKPLQRPYPRVFAPLAYRMTTALFWVEEGGTAVCYADNDEFIQTAFRVLSERAAETGASRPAPPLAVGAFLLLGETQEDVDEIRRDFTWMFDTVYNVPPFNIPFGRVLVGTPDEVSRQIEEVRELVDIEEMFIWQNIHFHRQGLERRSLELFVEKVLPRFSASPTADPLPA